METMRLTLIFLHTFIIIFAAINLHFHFASIAKALNHQQKISAIIHYIFDLIRISLYHAASIIVVWISHHYGAGMIRASGILLIGELLQATTSVIKLTIEAKHIDYEEIFFIVIYDLLLLPAVLITFHFAEKLSEYQKNLMQRELLVGTVNDVPIDDNFESMMI